MKAYFMNIGRSIANRSIKKPRKPRVVNKVPYGGSGKYGRLIKEIAVHCTATPQTTTITSIERYWFNIKGWSRGGYHFIITPDGIVHAMIPLHKISNGIRGFNKSIVNISYIGGQHGVDNRTDQQKAAMKELIMFLRSQSELGPVRVRGHRDFSPDLNNDGKITRNEWTKMCPSFEVKDWLKEENII